MSNLDLGNRLIFSGKLKEIEVCTRSTILVVDQFLPLMVEILCSGQLIYHISYWRTLKKSLAQEISRP